MVMKYEDRDTDQPVEPRKKGMMPPGIAGKKKDRYDGLMDMDLNRVPKKLRKELLRKLRKLRKKRKKPSGSADVGTGRTDKARQDSLRKLRQGYGKAKEGGKLAMDPKTAISLLKPYLMSKQPVKKIADDSFKDPTDEQLRNLLQD